MKQTTMRLFPGDLVEVKSPQEILSTLDSEGTVDRLPFMPEMIEHCGKRFRVLRRAVKVCTSGAGATVRAFRGDNVVLLEGLRCSGKDHDGCEKACMIFWREAWLRKVDQEFAPAKTTDEDVARLRAQLKTSTGPNTYFCQASELLRAANQLSRPDRFTTCVKDISARNTSISQMLKYVAIWLFWRARRIVFGAYARGDHQSTPAQSLNLCAGDLVQVKSLGQITQTLNRTAHNRGLWFSPDMRLLCGRQKRVERRIDKIIVDGTGEMRRLHNTVYLEGSMCGCAHVAFGGCSRNEFVYWREIWLGRVSGSES